MTDSWIRIGLVPADYWDEIDGIDSNEKPQVSPTQTVGDDLSYKFGRGSGDERYRSRRIDQTVRRFCGRRPRSLQRGRGRNLWPAGTEWRGQDHADPHADHAHPAVRRLGPRG